MADDVVKKLDELRRQATQKLDEARATVAQMNTVESLFDLPLTSLSDLETAAPTGGPPVLWSPSPTEERSANPPTPAALKRRGSASIRPDEYFGVEPMEAAKMFMRSIGHAVHFDEITDAVQKGGAATKGADWRERLEISLKRSPYQVITVAEKTYGLADFYTEEQLKRFRNSRRGESESSAKKKSKPKAKPKGGSAAKKVAPKPPAPSTKPKPAKKKSSAAPIEPPTAKTDGAASEPVH